MTSLAVPYSLPAVYPYRFFAEVGGLLSHGTEVQSASESDWTVHEPHIRNFTAQPRTVCALELGPARHELSRYLKYIARAWRIHAFLSSSPTSPATQSVSKDYYREWKRGNGRMRLRQRRCGKRGSMRSRCLTAGGRLNVLRRAAPPRKTARQPRRTLKSKPAGALAPLEGARLALAAPSLDSPDVARGRLNSTAPALKRIPRWPFFQGSMGKMSE
jgi:hypothetical protein